MFLPLALITARLKSPFNKFRSFSFVKLFSLNKFMESPSGRDFLQVSPRCGKQVSDIEAMWSVNGEIFEICGRAISERFEMRDRPNYDRGWRRERNFWFRLPCVIGEEIPEWHHNERSDAVTQFSQQNGKHFHIEFYELIINRRELSTMMQFAVALLARFITITSNAEKRLENSFSNALSTSDRSSCYFQLFPSQCIQSSKRWFSKSMSWVNSRTQFKEFHN